MDAILRLVTQRWTIDGSGHWVPRSTRGDEMDNFETPESQQQLLAEIIQGEAAPSDDAMVAVARCLAECIKRGDDATRTAKRWMGRATPTKRAEELAAGILAGATGQRQCAQLCRLYFEGARLCGSMLVLYFFMIFLSTALLLLAGNGGLG